MNIHSSFPAHRAMITLGNLGKGPSGGPRWNSHKGREVKLRKQKFWRDWLAKRAVDNQMTRQMAEKQLCYNIVQMPNTSTLRQWEKCK